MTVESIQLLEFVLYALNLCRHLSLGVNNKRHVRECGRVQRVHPFSQRLVLRFLGVEFVIEVSEGERQQDEQRNEDTSHRAPDLVSRFLTLTNRPLKVQLRLPPVAGRQSQAGCHVVHRAGHVRRH